MTSMAQHSERDVAGEKPIKPIGFFRLFKKLAIIEVYGRITIGWKIPNLSNHWIAQPFIIEPWIITFLCRGPSIYRLHPYARLDKRTRTVRSWPSLCGVNGLIKRGYFSRFLPRSPICLLLMTSLLMILSINPLDLLDEQARCTTFSTNSLRVFKLFFFFFPGVCGSNWSL